MTLRTFILPFVALLFTTGMAGQCSVSGDAADVALIAQGVAAMAPQIESLTGAPASIGTYANDIATLAASLEAAPSATTAASLIADAEALASAAAAIPGLPAEVTIGLQAVNVLLPVIATAYNTLAPASASRTQHSAAWARLQLQATATK